MAFRFNSDHFVTIFIACCVAKYVFPTAWFAASPNVSHSRLKQIEGIFPQPGLQRSCHQ